jgi:cellulose synthase/poly-beta-1,6-N-acetylglucosamine synthase-like glycosyltransferase
LRFSLISPTFKRPDEVTEFLESLLKQDHQDFEVILGDGTPGDTLRPELARFQNNGHYPLKIVYEEYLPVSDARNRAAAEATGDYLIFFDSDCIIPPDYLRSIERHLHESPLDAFGGPDMAHKDFTDVQKAISYSMTSMLTTGGIRGKEKSVSTYHPRGFNMGMRREVFEELGGYSEFRCGEDIEFSIRIIKAGYKVGLIPEAYVFHKRRTTIKQFFRQVFRFGAARINIWKRHPEEMKLTHLFPFVFMAGTVVVVLFFLLFPTWWVTNLFMGFILLYLVLIFLDSFIQNKSMRVALLSMITSVVMHYGYGWGFLRNWWAWTVLGREGGMKL